MRYNFSEKPSSYLIAIMILYTYTALKTSLLENLPEHLFWRFSSYARQLDNLAKYCVGKHFWYNETGNTIYIEVIKTHWF